MGLIISINLDHTLDVKIIFKKIIVAKNLSQESLSFIESLFHGFLSSRRKSLSQVESFRLYTDFEKNRRLVNYRNKNNLIETLIIRISYYLNFFDFVSKTANNDLQIFFISISKLIHVPTNRKSKKLSHVLHSSSLKAIFYTRQHLY